MPLSLELKSLAFDFGILLSFVFDFFFIDIGCYREQQNNFINKKYRNT
jgi:hypothetical protein